MDPLQKPAPRNASEPAERWTEQFKALQTAYGTWKNVYDTASGKGDSETAKQAKLKMDEITESIDQLNDFRRKLKKYCSAYTYISQIIDLGDPDLEVFYGFAKLLAHRISGTPLEEIDIKSLVLSDFKINRLDVGEPDDDNATLKPMRAGGTAKTSKKESLKEIVFKINEIWGDDVDKTKAARTINAIADFVAADEISRIQIRNSTNTKEWAIDHFHVVMKANEAVDDVRRKLQSDMPKRERIKTKRGFAYTLKKRMDDLTEEEAEKIKLARRSEKTAPFAVAYDLKEDFFNIYDNNPSSKEAAQQAFAEWEASIPQDELYDKFRDLAKTVHNFYDQIFAYWDCPIAISNGFTECTNRLIRENNCRGRGYSFEVLKARTLFRRKNLALMFQNDLVTQNFGPSIPENEPVFHFEGSKNDTSYDDDDEDDDYEPFPEEDDIGVEEPED